MIFAKAPTYTEEIQNNNPLVKRIYKLKMGTKAAEIKEIPKGRMDESSRIQAQAQNPLKSVVSDENT
jgi:hypothetical protein